MNVILIAIEIVIATTCECELGGGKVVRETPKKTVTIDVFIVLHIHYQYSFLFWL